jgi:hypothetical protein
MYLEKLIQIQTGMSMEGHRLCAPAKNTDILFVSHRDMVYPVWEELGITAFYAGRCEAARRHLDRKIIDSALTFHEHNRLLDLYRWYAWRLPTVGAKRVSLALPSDAVPFLAEGFWKAFNPSIRLAESGNHYVLNLRHANYETKEARIYTYRGREGLIITRNVIERFDGDLRPMGSALEVCVPEEFIVNKHTNIHGFEDCRWLGDSSLIATARQFTASDTNKMVRVNLDPSGAIVSMKPLLAPVPREEADCQKNWLPFLWRGEEVFVYKLNPFQVFSMKGYRPIVEWSPPAASGITFDNLRGSAPPVPWRSTTHPDEAFVLVTHFCYYGAANEGRRYYHRFITLTETLVPSRIGTIFSLCDDPIQYVAGMCPAVQEKPGVYVITYGVGDSQAWAVEVEAATIEESLKYELGLAPASKRSATTPFDLSSLNPNMRALAAQELQAFRTRYGV